MRYFCDLNVLYRLLLRFIASVAIPLALAAVTVFITVRSLAWHWISGYGTGLLVGLLAYALSIERLDPEAELFDLPRHLAKIAACFLIPVVCMAVTVRLVTTLLPEARWLTYPACGLVGLGTFAFVAGRLHGEVKKPKPFRGRSLISFQAARRKARALLGREDPGLLWGGLIVPSDRATDHFIVYGTSGSGKTLMIVMLMGSVLRRVVAGNGWRALIYDAKRDVLGKLHGMGLSCAIKTLNPFDARCVAWDIARDVTTPAAAFQIASILIPEDRNATQPFFVKAAQHILYGVLLALLMTAGTAWTFCDVVYAMQSAERIRELLEKTPETREILDQYFSVPERIADIIATIATKMLPYGICAAAWSRATERISLREWLEEEYILVLGSDEAARSAMEAINRMIIQRISELILSQPDSSTRRHWIFIDEVRMVGHLDCLGNLMTNGRSKGAAIVLGLQDIEGMRDLHGDKAANEIVGQCSNVAILRLSSPETAKFASEVFGNFETLEQRTSESSSKGKQGKTSGSTVSEQLVQRPSVLSSEFLELPPTTPKTGLSGYIILPGIGSYKTTLSETWIAQHTVKPNPDIPNFVPRPEEHQYLMAWTEDDRQRLGLASGSNTEPPQMRRTRPPTPQPQQPSDEQTPLSMLKGFGQEA